MKKGLLFTVILLILATSVLGAAVENETKLVPRMTNFMGDNIHIIRVQELSAKLDTQISTLDTKLADLDNKLAELENIKANMNRPVKVSTTGLATQYNTINTEIKDIKRSMQEIQDMKQELQQPEPVKQSNPAIFIIALLALNSVLLITTVYVFYTKKPKTRKIKTMHEYIANCIDDGVEEHEIKHELLKKGWSTKEINKAFEEI